MPTYQYLCAKCKSSFELRQSFDDEPTAACPACNNIARRIFSPVPVLFKGPGFYITDSRPTKEESSCHPQTSKKEDKSGSEQ